MQKLDLAIFLLVPLAGLSAVAPFGGVTGTVLFAALLTLVLALVGVRFGFSRSR